MRRDRTASLGRCWALQWPIRSGSSERYQNKRTSLRARAGTSLASQFLVFDRQSARPLSRLQVEVETSSPRRQLLNRPHPRTLGIRLMPGPRLENVKFRNESVHVGIELDQKTARVVVIGSEVVARSVPRRPPEDGMVFLCKK